MGSVPGQDQEFQCRRRRDGTFSKSRFSDGKKAPAGTPHISTMLVFQKVSFSTQQQVSAGMYHISTVLVFVSEKLLFEKVPSRRRRHGNS